MTRWEVIVKYLGYVLLFNAFFSTFPPQFHSSFTKIHSLRFYTVQWSAQSLALFHRYLWKELKKSTSEKDCQSVF